MNWSTICGGRVTRGMRYIPGALDKTFWPCGIQRYCIGNSAERAGIHRCVLVICSSATFRFGVCWIFTTNASISASLAFRLSEINHMQFWLLHIFRHAFLREVRGFRDEPGVAGPLPDTSISKIISVGEFFGIPWKLSEFRNTPSNEVIPSGHLSTLQIEMLSRTSMDKNTRCRQLGYLHISNVCCATSKPAWTI
jgi:hypothetical protein